MVDGVVITTVGGDLPIHVHAATDPVGAVVALLPALGIRASYYEAFARQLAEAGVHVVRADYPGHGDSSIRPGRRADWGYGELVSVDAAALAAAARRRFADSALLMVGHSIGGQFALMHAGANQQDVVGVALLASGSPHWRCWSPGYGARVLGSSYLVSALTTVVGHHPGDRVGFGGREPSLLMKQWARIVRTGRFALPGFDGDALLRRCDRPVLGLRLRGDHWAPERSLRALLARTSTRRLVVDSWGDAPGINHNNWPRSPAAPAARVAQWARSLAADAPGAAGPRSRSS